MCIRDRYKVKFYAGSGANYLTQYYDGESSVSKADAVSVSDDSVTSGIDAEMVIGGKITGEVTSASSEEGVEGIEVCAYSPGGESDGCASTGSSGEYTIVGLATGQYSVCLLYTSPAGPPTLTRTRSATPSTAQTPAAR